MLNVLENTCRLRDGWRLDLFRDGIAEYLSGRMDVRYETTGVMGEFSRERWAGEIILLLECDRRVGEMQMREAEKERCWWALFFHVL